MRSLSQPLVSVVTPCYNGEPYLEECIESVLAQAYTNWEYVIVDNASTDRSLDIAQRYAKRDPRIRVVENSWTIPALANMNHSMRQMSKDSVYCKVVHADDWLFQECLTRMVEVAEGDPTVGIVGSYRLSSTSSTTSSAWRVDLDGLPYPSTVVHGHQICRKLFLQVLYLFGSPSSLLVRSELIRNKEAFYNEHSLYADAEACLQLLQKWNFGYVHQVLTFNREHSESVTGVYHRNHHYIFSYLDMLKQYGHQYLTPAEYRCCFEDLMERHYKFLGKAVLEVRGKEFWKYNKSELQRLGYPFSIARLARVYYDELTMPIRLVWRALSGTRGHNRTSGTI